MSITNDFEDKRGFVDGHIGYDLATVSELLAHARALEAMLKKHEWCLGVGQDHDAACPECEEWKYFGKHAPDCALAKLLEGTNQ